MLCTRVIPVVLIDGYSVVKTIQFKERRNLGNPITVARVYNTRNVDEMILLDIDASKQNRSIDLFTIEEITSECFMPLAVGGGLRTLDDIRSVLCRGADKVVLNTIAIDDPNFIAEASSVFGAQCIVASVDIKKDGDNFYVFSRGQIVDKDPFEWILQLQQLGAGEMFITSVDRDGTMTECENEIICKTVPKLEIPLIYNGGVSCPKDMVIPVKQGVSSVAAASIFHFTRWTPDSCKSELRAHGIPVRLIN